MVGLAGKLSLRETIVSQFPLYRKCGRDALRTTTTRKASVRQHAGLSLFWGGWWWLAQSLVMATYLHATMHPRWFYLVVSSLGVDPTLPSPVEGVASVDW